MSKRFPTWIVALAVLSVAVSVLVAVIVGSMLRSHEKQATAENPVVAENPVTAKDVAAHLFERASVHYLTDIKVTTEREDPPKFKTVYTRKLPGGFTVKVTLYTTFVGDRLDMSELTQANGKYVLFSVNAVADKILDRELYPLVQKAVDDILEMDKVFMESNPDMFIDSTGAIWARK